MNFLHLWSKWERLVNELRLMYYDPEGGTDMGVAEMAGEAPSLDTELETYRRLLPTLTTSEGRFALIAGTELLGLYDTYVDALTAGYAARALQPFLVKQIATFETIANFSRDMRPCLTSRI